MTISMRVAAEAAKGSAQSPGRFAWMFGGGVREQSAPPPDEFSAACTMLLENWQALPVAAPALFAWGGTANRNSDDASIVRDRLTAWTVLSRIQLTLLHRLVDAFESARIPYTLLKGTAIRFTAYTAPLQRIGKDIDVGVPIEFIDAAEQVAMDLGLLPSQWDPTTNHFKLADPVLRADVEAGHYELGFLARRQVIRDLTDEEDAAIRRDIARRPFLWHELASGELACYVYADLHHGISLDTPVEPLVRTARRIRAAGGTVRLPAIEWMLFHAIYKLYWEGVHNYGKGGYQFADIARLVPMLDDGAIARLLALFDETNFDAGAHYVLRRLEPELDTVLPDPLAAFVERASAVPADREPLQVNDLGDMWPKIWGHR